MASSTGEQGAVHRYARLERISRTASGWLNELWDWRNPAPFVTVTIEYQGRRQDIEFLIDSGSDITILMPRNAYDVIGDNLFDTNFHGSGERAFIEGVGSSGYHAVPLNRASVSLEDEVQAQIELPIPHWVAEPQPRWASDDGNWALPSIFGRDAIRPGDFQLSYINGTVTLFRPDNE